MKFYAAALALLLSVSPAPAQSEGDFDPDKINVVDAIDCRLSAQEYTGFAITLDDADAGYRKRGWIKQESENPFLLQFLLPAPIEIAGHQTRTIVFASSGVLAVLDVADPSELAQQEHIKNQVPGGRKFLGEREIMSQTDKDEKTGWRTTMRITRSLSTVDSHPGKTLLGCGYAIDVKLPGED